MSIRSSGGSPVDPGGSPVDPVSFLIGRAKEEIDKGEDFKRMGFVDQIRARYRGETPSKLAGKAIDILHHAVTEASKKEGTGIDANEAKKLAAAVKSIVQFAKKHGIPQASRGQFERLDQEDQKYDKIAKAQEEAHDAEQKKVKRVRQVLAPAKYSGPRVDQLSLNHQEIIEESGLADLYNSLNDKLKGNYSLNFMKERIAYVKKTIAGNPLLVFANKLYMNTAEGKKIADLIRNIESIETMGVPKKHHEDDARYITPIEGKCQQWRNAVEVTGKHKPPTEARKKATSAEVEAFIKNLKSPEIKEAYLSYLQSDTVLRELMEKYPPPKA
jgi:hypothetical protein